MKKSELKQIIKEEIQKILTESFVDKLFNDESVEDSLRTIKGYDTIIKNESDDLHIYFKDKNAAIKGARLLSQILPGPDYINNIDKDVKGVLMGDASYFILIKNEKIRP